jgi:hypothetical protein
MRLIRSNNYSFSSLKTEQIKEEGKEKTDILGAILIFQSEEKILMLTSL